MASTGVGPPDFPGSPHRYRGNNSGNNSGGGGGGGGGGRDGTMFRLTPDELRAMSECRRESFFYRSIPIMAVSMTATHFAVANGYLRGSPKYGSLFKVIGAGAIGYFIGKLSYLKQCENKLMQLPNSRLAEEVRRRRQGLPMSMNTSSTNQDEDYAESSANLSDTSGLGGSGTWDINAGDNGDIQGLDDLQRPSMDNPMTVADDEKSLQSDLVYESLRKRNREEYEARRASALYDMNRSEQERRQQVQSPPPTSSRTTTTTTSSGVRNKYGDLVD